MEPEERSPGGDEVCPAPEDLATFIDGCLPHPGRDRIIAHLNRCSVCYGIFVETLRAQAGSMRWPGTTSAPPIS